MVLYRLDSMRLTGVQMDIFLGAAQPVLIHAVTLARTHKTRMTKILVCHQLITKDNSAQPTPRYPSLTKLGVLIFN